MIAPAFPTWTSADGRATIYHGDCLDVMRSMPDGSVDAVVTDPPYGTGAWKRAAAGSGGDCRAVMSREAWDEWDASWFIEASRITKGPILIFCPQTRLPEVIALAGDSAWRIIIWGKPDPRPRFAGQMAYAFEPIVAIGSLQGHGGADLLIDSAPRLNRDADATGHPHQKPIGVVRALVRVSCPKGGVVLDPHLGSGTTLVEALQEGCKAIGIEREAPYVEIAKARVAHEAAQGRLFA